MLIKACLNGPRRPGDHPALPCTPAAVARDAAAVVAAGAGALHVHPKDDAGADSLDPEDVAAVVTAVREAVPGIPVGVTTGAWALRDPELRVAAVRAWTVLPDFASLNWHEEGADAVAAALLDRGVQVEAGLWHLEGVAAWAASPYRDHCLRLLLELPDGLDAGAVDAEAARLLAAVGERSPVLLHGMGSSTWPRAAAGHPEGSRHAHRAGGRAGAAGRLAGPGQRRAGAGRGGRPRRRPVSPVGRAASLTGDMGTTQPGADAPIGIFDSGVGGLTVARAVLDQLPGEAIRYIGDTANGPYGPLPIAEVRRHSLAVMDDLVADGVKMLVVACNSASAASLRDARERYDVPVVEVVLPAVRRATAATRNGRIGVIGTQATITSGAYEDAFAAVPGIGVTSAACPSFVDFVERGVTSGRQLLGLAQSYLDPLLAAGVDTVVLGCTHYPLLTGVLSLVLGDGRHAGLQRGGDGQGRLPGADQQRSAARRGRPRAAARLPRHRRPRALRPAGPPVPRPRDRLGAAHRRRGCGMRLTVVGCSGSGPGPGSPASSYLVEHDGYRLLLDLGNGAFGALQGLIDPGTVDALFLSHLHADHCLDVAPFVVWHRYSKRSPGRLVPLYAPVGAERRLALAYDADGDGLTDVFDFVPVGPGALTIGPFEVELARTAHPVETYAIRLTAGGRSLVYTGDTGVVRPRRRARPRRRRAARRGRAPRQRPRPAAGPAPHRQAGRPARGRGGGGPAPAHPHPRVGRPHRSALRRQRGVLRDRAGAAPGVYDI